RVPLCVYVVDAIAILAIDHEVNVRQGIRRVRIVNHRERVKLRARSNPGKRTLSSHAAQPLSQSAGSKPQPQPSTGKKTYDQRNRLAFNRPVHCSYSDEPPLMYRSITAASSPTLRLLRFMKVLVCRTMSARSC